MNYTITPNKDFNSFEILFNGKPNEQTRSTLKANGYKWHSLKKVWYGYKDIASILNGSQAEKDTTSELTGEYLEKVKAYYKNDLKMVDFYQKNIGALTRLDNGDIVNIEKSRILTSFCFGYGMYLNSTEEDEKAANEMAENASTNTQYFINENLEGINKRLKRIEEIKENRGNYLYIYHSSYIKGIAEAYCVEAYEFRYENWRYKDYSILSADELARLENALLIEKAHFEKRLATYLKKYGLSKLNVWTYLQD